MPEPARANERSSTRGAIVIGLGISPDEPTCSRAGCDEVASTAVNWRNPKIHGVDRVKVWLACDEHAPFLRDFLETRSFPVLVTPLGTVVERVPDTEASGAGRA